jgi:VanZ family protein
MPDTSHRRLIVLACQVGLVLYGLTMFAATHAPPGKPVAPVPYLDKIQHFAAYALLAAMFATTWQVAAGHLTTGHLGWAGVAIAAWGIFDEVTQIPFGRECSIRDC